MSFEIYVQCFGETEKLGLSRDAVRDLFPVDEASSEPDYWKLRYDSREECDIGVNPFEANAAKLSGFNVHRPCRELRLWDSLFTVLNMGSVVIFFPGGPLIVEQKTSAAGLPEEMIESLGTPVQVDFGEAIRRIVEA